MGVEHENAAKAIKPFSGRASHNHHGTPLHIFLITINQLVMKTEPNEPINPCVIKGYECDTDVHGLTKREYFAALAMQGLCANPDFLNYTPYDIAVYAVIRADALISALNQ